jgi:hypothetical protein
MPKAFQRATAHGAKIRTVDLGEGHYMRVAIRPHGAKGPRGGRTIAGEVKHRKR